jgi:hypothetical protein
MLSGGRRVSIDATSPCTDFTVGVEISGAFWPTFGTVSWDSTRAPIGELATSRPPIRDSATTAYTPGFGNRSCAE